MFGPVAGGERAPFRLRRDYSLFGHSKDIIRDIMNLLVTFDPMMGKTFHHADIIYTITPDTREFIPKKFHNKVRIQLEIGIDSTSKKRNNAKEKGLKVLYVGRFLYWKGMALGLRAFAQAITFTPDLS